MLLELRVGNLSEALSGRQWDQPAIAQQFLCRVGYYHQHGMGPGDRVFVHFGNTLELFADLLAIWHLGGCAVPIDTRLTPFEIEILAKAAAPRFALQLGAMDSSVHNLLDGVGATVLDSRAAGESVAAPPLPPSGLILDGDALILFTSGSTGSPKGVVHTHRSLRAQWMTLRHSLGLDAYRRTLCLLPTHFGHGLICNCLFPWLSGQDLVLAPAGSVTAISNLGRLIDEHRITFMSSVPPIWRLALKTALPARNGTLQRVFCGSAPLSAHLWRQIRAWSGTPDVCNAYGITETASWLAGTTVGTIEPEDGLIGVPWGGVITIMKDATTDRPLADGEQCRSGEAGFVWVNTPALMRGYLGRDDLTARVVCQGWFATGDIGLVDDRGWLYLRGRERDEINRGGTKIYPADVESVVERFDGVEDVCCFALDDPLYGQALGMAVVLVRRDDDTLRALHAWMRQHLATFQLPSRSYVLDTIPRTSRGKLNRDTVAAACAALVPQELGPRSSGAA